MDNSKLIAKMKKLLAMSQDAGSEHEAMIATKRLHAMLAKHNVSMNELGDKEEIGEGGTIAYNRPWKRMIAKSVATLYFCDFYYEKTSVDKCWFMFVGSEANRSFALHIVTMIFKTLEREARKESKKLYGKEVSSFFNSFCIGAMQRIKQRCNDLIGDAKTGNLQDDEGNTLPALLSTYESIQIDLDNWLSDNKSITTKSTRTRSNNSQGLEKGREAGNRVQLSRAIQGKQAPKLLG